MNLDTKPCAEGFCQICGVKLGGGALAVKVPVKLPGISWRLEAHVQCLHVLGNALVKLGEQYGAGRGERQ